MLDKFHFFCISLLLFCGNTIIAQPTVGLQYHTDVAFEGYTLFAPGTSEQTFLIDNCGYVVHVWNCSDIPELSVYLLEDGALLRASPEFIEKLSWEGELLWLFNYEENDLEVWPHHDIEPLPNGNVLIIAARFYNIQEGIRNGRNPSTIGNSVEIDGILEIQPTGKFTGKLIWEWNAFDHIVQDFDTSRLNYGIVEENSGKLDINYSLHEDDGLEDWLHLNSVAYNADLDQILFSSRHTSEIYIIDHSTTAEEVKTDQGGKSNKGGNFLWRWGNPQVYDTGTEEDRMLFGQHDSKWIPKGHPDAGKISVFNNGFQREGEYSSIHILEPVTDDKDNYLLADNNTFAPLEFDFTWKGEVLNEPFWGPIESGTHSLANGNFIICEVRGRFFEINPVSNQVVWVYNNPVGEQTYSQYQYLEEWTNTFRAEKYALDYPAFLEKDLSPQYLLEGRNQLSETCNMMVNSIESQIEMELNIFQQNRMLSIQSIYPIKQVSVFNINGQYLYEQQATILNFDVPGIYWLNIHFENFFSNKKIVVY